VFVSSASSDDAPDGAVTSALPAVLTATGLCHSYGDRTVLDGVSLTVHAGERVAIVGENGAGKTTLMRICARLMAPGAGTLEIDGRVGYCPQIPGLHDLLTPDEHLALFSPALGLTRSEGIARGRELLAEFGFPPADHRSQIRHLSGGCQQKLNLTLALLGGARLLLLDEPYQGFDHGSYMNFWDHVSRWSRQGIAVIVVTHMLADLDLVDRVVSLTPVHDAVAA
jgi:ABC-type multidrug transport system ATPase subunit